MFFVIFLSIFTTFAQNEIKSHISQLPNAVAGFDYVIEQHAIPKNLLAAAVKEVLKRENTQQVTITYDANSFATAIEIETASKDLGLSTRSLDERTLNDLLPPGEDNSISSKEQNGLRTLLVIRCVGLGAGLFISTGSSLAVAAYAGILNYIMMEALYIPKKNGHMPGIDFVNSIMEKSVNGVRAQDPNASPRRLAVVEGLTNFIVNYTMNFAMLVPFLGMTGADFQSYLHAFTQTELYTETALMTLKVTVFLSSWKMAFSRWQRMKAEYGIEIMQPKTQGR
jgi:hypothetical protein